MGFKAQRAITCLFCEREAVGRKLCRRHYMNMLNAGKLAQFPLLGPEDTFYMRYKVLESGCWEWTGTRNQYGYGIVLMKGEKGMRAHRFSYELYIGKIPNGKIVMHTCDHPPCVNPQHLRLGTKADNNRDTAIKRRHNYGLDHWNGKLSDAQIQEIRESKASQTNLAKFYGVTQSHISYIINLKHRKPFPP